MRRTVKFSLGLANTTKKQILQELSVVYCKGVNQYLQKMQSESKYILSNQEVKEGNKVLSESYKQCVYNKAVAIWKSWRRNKRKGQLSIYNGCIDLDSRFIIVEKAKNTSFDYWVKISTLNKGKRVVIPFKSYDYANQYWNEWQLCKGGKIKVEDDGKLSLILTFEKETPKKKQIGKQIGIDIGIKKLMVDSDANQYGKEIEDKMDKIQRKQQGSKAFDRALRERDYYVNKIVKELPFNDLKLIVMENIKNIKQNTKKEKRLRKEFRSKFQRWTYAKLISRIEQISEADGVHCLKIDPAYTSQTCSKCGFVHKSNRNGELFLCKNCGCTLDADFNASKNILNLGLASENVIPRSIEAYVL